MPQPLIHLEVDLRDFSWMPLEINRLRRSKAWLICKRRPDLAFYMLNLWTASWHDTPAASLEDDDDVLADLAMCEPSKWSKVRESVLRGWVKCDDGRLYHPVVAEMATSAWKQKQSQRQRTEAARQAREQKRLHGLSSAVRDATTLHVTASVTDSVTELRQDPTDRRGTGEGEGPETLPVVGPPNHDPPPAARAAASRGCRLGQDWQLPRLWGEWALAEFESWTAEKVRVEAEKFRDHWVAKTGKDATKADWLATWRNWCRSGIAHRDDPKPIGETPWAREARERVHAMTGGLVSAKPPGTTKETIDGTGLVNRAA